MELAEIRKKIERLETFPKDWDSYGGLPLRPEVKYLVLQVLGPVQRDNLPMPAVVLGPAGTIQLEWRSNGKELEIEIARDSIYYTKALANGAIEEGEIAIDQPGRLRGLLAWLLCA
jgi:hypothetical protein